MSSAVPSSLFVASPPGLTTGFASAGELAGGALLGAIVPEALPPALDGVPSLVIGAPVLAGGEWGPEVVRAHGPVRSGVAEGISYRADGRLLFGVLMLEERAQGRDDGATPLQAAAEAAYGRIFRLMEALAYPHLWRAWNYMADINGESFGLERYRQFNVGRYDAFVAAGRLQRASVPAACALGVAEGPLRIAFLASRLPALPVENPRQMSAYEYPPDYGPRSPTFARAALAELGGEELLFVSGTASIVGHLTRHRGDVAGQARETLENIDALLAEVGRLSRPWAQEALAYRIYVRDAASLQAVRVVAEGRLGAHVPMTYVQADICRADLLLEIEACGARPCDA